MAERNAATVATRQMHYRIGISLGDVIHDEARLYGGGVNIAARLEALAGPRGVCVSGEAYAQVHRKPPLRFIDLSEQDLKNIGAPVRVYRIDLTEFHATSRSGEKAPLALPSNPRSPSSLSPSRNISAHKAARKEVDRVRPNHLRQRGAAKHDSDHGKPVRPLRSRRNRGSEPPRIPAMPSVAAPMALRATDGPEQPQKSVLTAGSLFDHFDSAGEKCGWNG